VTESASFNDLCFTTLESYRALTVVFLW
jgi:hypothetical protein